MAKNLKVFFVISLFSLLPTLLIWIPFFFRFDSFWGIPLPTNGMATIVANFDGPLYIVVAKSFYNFDVIKQIVSFPLSFEYYAAHFPLFPMLIRALSYLTGYPYAVLIVTLFSSIAAVYFFHLLTLKYFKKDEAVWLTFIFSIFPARWLIVRSVGSAEPLFITAIMASIYYFKMKKFLSAGIWGAVAQLTKSVGILLFVAYLMAIIIPKLKRLANQSTPTWLKNLKLISYTPLLLIPITLLSIFTLYTYKFHNFFAYFSSGDNIHVFFPPFQIFNYAAPWVGTFWLEEIIFAYLLGTVAVVKLFQQGRGVIAWFTATFFTSLLFVAHRDLIRYALPIVPFVLIAFSDYLLKKEFKFVMALLVIPIYLFSLAYISQNTMPISDWAPLL